MAETPEDIPSDSQQNNGICYVQIFRFFLAALIIVGAVFVRKLIVDNIMVALKTLSGMEHENEVKARSILAGPLSLLCIMGGVYIASLVADTPDELDFLITYAHKSFLHVVIFYVVYHSVDPVALILKSTSTGTMANELREIALKVIKVLVCVIGLLSILQDWGVNVSAFLSVMGLAGMAFALAAQDTMKNFFGTIVVLADDIFHSSDWIKTPQVEGIVEHFGLRTTFIRGFDTSQITIPNATVADTSIVNFGRCTERQVCWTLPVVAPNNESFVKVVDSWREHLQHNPDVSQNRLIIVQLDKFGCACIEVFVLFFTKETAWLKYMEQKEKIILEFNKIIGHHGCKFGIPTTSILLNKA